MLEISLGKSVALRQATLEAAKGLKGLKGLKRPGHEEACKARGMTPIW